MYHLSGVREIIEERMNQVYTNGYDESYDSSVYHKNGELLQAARYLLGDKTAFPDSWNNAVKSRFDKFSKTKKLRAAGALIAAEIDRLKTIDRPMCSTCTFRSHKDFCLFYPRQPRELMIASMEFLGNSPAWCPFRNE